MVPTTPSRPLPSTTTTPIPRSKRQPFEPVRPFNQEVTPRAAAEEPVKPPNSVAPLFVTKKSSVRSNASVLSAGSPGSGRRGSGNRRVSPLGKGAFANGSPRRVSLQRAQKLPSLLESLDAATENKEPPEVDRLVRLAETTKEDVSGAYNVSPQTCQLIMVTQIESSRRALKRIRLETEKITTASPVRSAVAEWETRPASPTKALRTPQRATPPAAAASALVSPVPVCYVTCPCSTPWRTTRRRRRRRGARR